MGGIKVLDRHRILLFQVTGGFSDKEIFTAKCLGFTTESQNRIVVDIRKTAKTALLEFKIVDGTLEQAGNIDHFPFYMWY